MLAIICITQKRSPRGRPVIPFGITCVCVLGPWPRIFLCPWPRALCPRFHLWYYVFINAIIVGVKVFYGVSIDLEKRVKSFLLLCFAIFTLLFSSIGLFDEGLGRIGVIGLTNDIKLDDPKLCKCAHFILFLVTLSCRPHSSGFLWYWPFACVPT